MSKFNEYVPQSNSDWLNLKEGENKLRLISEFESFGRHYDPQTKKSITCIGKDKGCAYCAMVDDLKVKLDTFYADGKSEKDSDVKKIIKEIMKYKVKVQFLVWVIDRTDGNIKLMSYGATVQDQLSTYAKSEEYGFDNLPSYDITIKKEGSGLDTTYTVLPSRKDTPITEEEQKDIDSMVKPLDDIIDKMKAKVDPIFDSPNPSDPTDVKDEDIPVVDAEDDGSEIKVKDIPF